MNTYYYTTIDRRNFGELLSEEGILHLSVKKAIGSALLSPPKNNAILAVWSFDPMRLPQLPEVLICEEGTQDDWAAWITTFAARIRPFSAYTRLMTLDDFEMSLTSRSIPDIGTFAWPMCGLILGEVLAASGLNDKALETLPASAFTSTLSYTIFRTAILYPNFDRWDRLVEMWNSVREVTNQRTRSINSALVAQVCSTALNAFDFPGALRPLKQNEAEVSDACRYLFISPENLLLNAAELSFENIGAILRGSREDRVRAFEEFINEAVKLSAPNPELLSLMLGYLASRIAPGTIKHSTVLSQVNSRYPAAMLWYGFWSGVGEFETDAKNSTRKRNLDFPLSARRIIRELFRPQTVLETPACDIGYLELIALSRTGGDFIEGLIKTSQGAVTVELMPGVCTAINFTTNQPAKPQIQDSKQREYLAAMGEQIEQIREIYKFLVGADDQSKRPEQGSLFSKQQKKRVSNRSGSSSKTDSRSGQNK